MATAPAVTDPKINFLPFCVVNQENRFILYLIEIFNKNFEAGQIDNCQLSSVLREDILNFLKLSNVLFTTSRNKGFDIFAQCNLKLSFKMRNYLLFIFGLILGVSLSFYLPVILNTCSYVTQELSTTTITNRIYSIPTVKNILSTKEPPKTILRPRYYSTELGIKEKILIGILTTEENIHTRATAINKTVTHLVDKIKFFITANNVISDITLKNVVGFTDSREILKPFHVIKYVVDNFIDEYDYFYIATDVSYIDARKLVSLVEGISVSHDVYMGVLSDEDSLYCNLGNTIFLLLKIFFLFVCY